MYTHIQLFIENCTETKPWYTARIPQIKYIWVVEGSWGAETTNLAQSCFMLALYPGWNQWIPSLTDPCLSPTTLVSKRHQS